jgi:hypothetical protein
MEMSLQSKKLENLVFMNKNWLGDPRDGCKLPFNLAILIQTNLSFEKKLEEYEGSFEQDEIVDI